MTQQIPDDKFKLTKIPEIPLNENYSDIMHDPRTYLKGAPSAYINTPNSQLISEHRRKALQLGVAKGNISYTYKGTTVIKKERVLLENGDQYSLESYITPQPMDWYQRPRSSQTEEVFCNHCGRNPFSEPEYDSMW